MNTKGNLMLNLLFFLMGLAVLVMFISPIQTFLGIAQQSDNLNCYGYIHQGNPSNPLSFNSTNNGGDSGSPMACLALKLYLPYILLVVLIAGVAGILAERSNLFGMGGEPQPQYQGY